MSISVSLFLLHDTYISFLWLLVSICWLSETFSCSDEFFLGVIQWCRTTPLETGEGRGVQEMQAKQTVFGPIFRPFQRKLLPMLHVSDKS